MDKIHFTEGLQYKVEYIDARGQPQTETGTIQSLDTQGFLLMGGSERIMIATNRVIKITPYASTL
jgi:hypothetical protein